MRNTPTLARYAALLGVAYMVFGGQLGAVLQTVGIDLPTIFGASPAPSSGWQGGGFPTATNNSPPFGGSPSFGTGGYTAPPLNAPPTVMPGIPAIAQPPVPVAGRPTLKIASYNIENWGKAKAAKPLVMQALAHLVRMFDVVAIQELSTQDDYYIDNFLRDYVNQPGLPPYDRRVSRRLGRSVGTEQYAYLYNTATVEVNPQVVFTIDDPSDLLHREPFVAMFRAKQAPPAQAFTFILMNIHTDPNEVPEELNALAQAYSAVQRMPIGGSTEDDVILLGDLNTAVPATPKYAAANPLRPLQQRDLGNLGLISGIYPLIQAEPTNTAQSKLHDNLIINQYATTEFTGQAGVLDIMRQFNTTREFADELSDHLPVWGEFSIYESAAPGRVANMPGEQR